MKKVIISFILLSIALPSNAFWFHKKDKTLEKELNGKGYAGTLPNIDDKYKQNTPKTTSPIFEVQDGFNNPSDLKPVPKDNPAFINIIQKKDKTSQFYNDITTIIPMLEKLIDSIEDDESIQLFISKANVLIVNIDYMYNKYNGKPESFYESFRKLQEVGNYTKSIITLRQEAVKYQRYLAYSSVGSVYNPENIAQQLEYLKQELNSTILMLREET